MHFLQWSFGSPSSLQDGGYEVAVPKPAFIELKEKAETGGTRSPKYPSTVTKVRMDMSFLSLSVKLVFEIKT